MTAFFVTGTDTGVGKTTIGAALLACLRADGHRVAALKPAETGCAPHPEDALLLARAAGSTAPLEDVCPNRYTLPAAPAAAARAEGRPFSLPATLAARDRLLATSEILLIEGAGGLLVPYDDTLLGVDLIVELGRPPLLLVARTGLGTLNHTALTVREAQRNGLRIAAIVLNRTTDESAPDPVPDMARMTGVPIFGPFPLLREPAQRDPVALAAAARTSLDLPKLFAALAIRPAVA